MNQELRGIEKATHPDGFVNFYAILGATPTTPIEEIQESINAMYQEAQNNRDHRVAARRREYQLLLEVLPQARTILLDDTRRKRYNAYCNAVEMESPRIPYPEFLSGLLREKEVHDARSDILTIRDLSRLRLVSPEEQPEEQNLPSIENSHSTSTAPAEEQPLKSQKPVQTTEIEAPKAETRESTDVPPVPAMRTPRFSPQSLSGGVIVLGGLLACLPTLAEVPLVLAAPLALVSAGVTAYVFAIAGNEMNA
jgi:hypothetical protein